MRAVYALGLLLVIGASAASAAKYMPDPAPEKTAQRAFLAPKTPDARPTALKPAVEVRQAPVPIRWATKHEAVAVPQGDGPTIGDIIKQASAQPVVPASDATGPIDPAAQSAAKAAIEADGYKGVRELAPMPDGRWKARVMRGRTEITVTVASDGSVAAE